mmetsp:Transcript_67020/g.216052  ORF Transcript_67020/g.216052 Transcript_67020/m.216052 type:complete len:201 (-) Transcript_67020:1712-2314(-)
MSTHTTSLSMEHRSRPSLRGMLEMHVSGSSTSASPSTRRAGARQAGAGGRSTSAATAATGPQAPGSCTCLGQRASMGVMTSAGSTREGSTSTGWASLRWSYSARWRSPRPSGRRSSSGPGSRCLRHGSATGRMSGSGGQPSIRSSPRAATLHRCRHSCSRTRSSSSWWRCLPTSGTRSAAVPASFLRTRARAACSARLPT